MTATAINKQKTERTVPKYKQSARSAVRRDEVYTTEELCLKVGWSGHAFRAARRNGLEVSYSGRQGFVSGEAFFRFIEALAGKSKRPCGRPMKDIPQELIGTP